MDFPMICVAGVNILSGRKTRNPRQKTKLPNECSAAKPLQVFGGRQKKSSPRRILWLPSSRETQRIKMRAIKTVSGIE